MGTSTNNVWFKSKRKEGDGNTNNMQPTHFVGVCGTVRIGLPGNEEHFITAETVDRKLTDAALEDKGVSRAVEVDKDPSIFPSKLSTCDEEGFISYFMYNKRV